MRYASQSAKAKGPREPQFMFLTIESIKKLLSRRADHDLRPNEVSLTANFSRIAFVRFPEFKC